MAKTYLEFGSLFKDKKKYLDLNFKFTNFQNFKKVVVRML